MDAIRRRFRASPVRRGYQVNELQPALIEPRGGYLRKFDRPQDAAWDATGPGRCFEAAAGAMLPTGKSSRLRPGSAAGGEDRG